MFKKDLLLSSDHDLAIIDFDLQLTTDQQAVSQRVKRKRPVNPLLFLNLF